MFGIFLYDAWQAPYHDGTEGQAGKIPDKREWQY